jgi:hypothetical protein
MDAGRYAYSVASMLVFFWAFSLLQSIYGWSAKPHLSTLLRKVNATGKIVSILLPALLTGLLQVKAIQKSRFGYTFLVNIICE